MSDFQGLWRGRQGWYHTKQFKLSELNEMRKKYKYFQLQMRYNKFHEKESDIPHFVIRFSPTNEKYGDPHEIPFSEELSFENLLDKLNEIKRLCVFIDDSSETYECQRLASKIEDITKNLLDKLED